MLVTLMEPINQNTKENISTKKGRPKGSLKENLKALIIRDSRESDEHGWKFETKVIPSSLEVVRIYDDKMDFADYSLVGHDLITDDDSIAIERKKSLSEFIQNISTNWERFQRELVGLSAYKHSYIIIEDDLKNAYSDYISKKCYWFNIHPDFIIARIAEIEMKYGIHTVFLSNTHYAQRFVLNLFKQILLSEQKEFIDGQE